MTTLTIVADSGGDWIIAAEDYPMVDGEADIGDCSDFHYGCQEGDTGGFFHGAGTGRSGCECGYWYDRHFWGL
jgi:hypothetical protein